MFKVVCSPFTNTCTYSNYLSAFSYLVSLWFKFFIIEGRFLGLLYVFKVFVVEGKRLRWMCNLVFRGQIIKSYNLFSFTVLDVDCILVRSYLELLLDFVNFNSSIMLKPKEDEEGWRAGHGERDQWRGSFMHSIPWGVLNINICKNKKLNGSCRCKGKDNVSKRLTTRQTSSSKYHSRRTTSSFVSILTLTTIDGWIVHLQELFVSTTVDAWAWKLERPITLNEFGPKMQEWPSSLFF